MKSKRRLPLVITAVSLVMLLLVGLTVAYLTDSRSTLNLLGIGVDEDGNENVEIEIDEPGFKGEDKDPSEVEDVEDYFDDDDLDPGEVPPGTEIEEKDDILPGAEIDKDPTIKSLGNESVYIRAKLVLGGVSYASNQAEYLKRFNMLVELGLEISSSFKLHTDGYYYYVDANGDSKVLTKDDGGAELFVAKKNAAGEDYTLKIPVSWDNDKVLAFREAFKVNADDDSKLIGINVVAEAIQSTNFDGNIGWIGEDDQPIKAIAVADQNRQDP